MHHDRQWEKQDEMNVVVENQERLKHIPDRQSNRDYVYWLHKTPFTLRCIASCMQDAMHRSVNSAIE